MAESRSDKDWQDIVNDLIPSLERRPDLEHPTYPEPLSTELPAFIDHTLLKLDATADQIDKICAEAKQYDFKSVCVRLPWVSRCIQNLQGSNVLVACVVGFHEGNYATAEKVNEATSVSAAGAKELDMVINYEYLKAKQYRSAFFDIQAVRMAAQSPIILKVILETSQLSHEQIVAGCLIAQAAGADFVKTSTGFNGRGASLDDVQLMKSVVKDAARVKASGGVRSKDDALAMIKAGASRIGTSAGVAIVQGASSTASY